MSNTFNNLFITLLLVSALFTHDKKSIRVDINTGYREVWADRQITNDYNYYKYTTVATSVLRLTTNLHR